MFALKLLRFRWFQSRVSVEYRGEVFLEIAHLYWVYLSRLDSSVDDREVVHNPLEWPNLTSRRRQFMLCRLSVGFTFAMIWNSEWVSKSGRTISRGLSFGSRTRGHGVWMWRTSCSSWSHFAASFKGWFSLLWLKQALSSATLLGALHRCPLSPQLQHCLVCRTRWLTTLLWKPSWRRKKVMPT